jgi:hypothetical protein
MLHVSNVIKTHGKTQIRHYDSRLRVGRTDYDLSEKCSGLEHVMGYDITLSGKLKGELRERTSANLFHYISMNAANQENCMHFAKYCINSKEYVPIAHPKGVKTPDWLIVLYDRCGWTHAGIYLGDGLMMSKLGQVSGLFVTDVKEMEDHYSAVAKRTTLFSPAYSRVFYYEKPDHERNMRAPNVPDVV